MIVLMNKMDDDDKIENDESYGEQKKKIFLEQGLKLLCFV